MGTRGLPRLAVDGAPDGMGMGMVMGLHSCVWGVVRSGQVRSAHGAFVCLGKGVPWTIGGIEDFPIIVMTDQRKRFV